MPVINYWAVLASGVAAMVVGGIWYGPLFGKMWMQGMGWDPNNKELMDKMKKSMGVAYAQMGKPELARKFILKGLAMPNVEKDDPETKRRGLDTLAKLK